MGANVFANGREISAKKSGDKTIAKMPDVCLSPPSPPAGPIPIPYPNFANSKDTTGGTKKVKIDGAEVGLKGKSSYKKCKGDNAATRSFGASVLSHNLEGPIKHVAGSFDVSFEGTNVVRFGDLTTGNHCNPSTGSMGLVVGSGAAGFGDAECAKLGDKNDAERKEVVDALEDKSSLNNQEQATLDKAQGTGMTISSATSTVPGAQGTISGSSSGVAQACNPNGLAPGGTSAQKMGLSKKIRESDDSKYDEAKAEAGVLCDDSHVHPGGGAGAHAEAKIINELSADSPMRGGSMLFNIDWRFKNRTSKKPMKSGMPCTHCHKMMCKAAKECNIKIFICDKEGKPQQLTEEDCDGSPEAREGLCEKIDGNPTPGR